MFFLYHHHDLKLLAELLTLLLKRDAQRSVLAPATVIVPNRGVARWLQVQIAEDDGIAANLDFPLPARFVWESIRTSLPGYPDSSGFERRRLRWHLYALLPDVAARDPRIKRYLDSNTSEVQRLQLADALADVFDQYLIYRADMLERWQAGDIGAGAPENWQAPIWQALLQRLDVQHRARLLREVIKLAEKNQLGTSRLPGSVYCFGLGDLPPDYLRLLYALSRHIDIHFLLPNLSGEYWADVTAELVQLSTNPENEDFPTEPGIDSQQPLVASFARGGRDLLRVLYSDELQAIHEPALGDALDYQPPVRDSLLHHLQSDVIELTAPEDAPQIAAADRSISVHACHGPLREIQVLRDQLLDLLSRHPDLQPRDIVVMMPSPDTYAPYIHAVFGDMDDDRHIRYSLSERSRGQTHPMVRSFRNLLDLPLSRWEASTILSLAAVPAVMRRFELDVAEIANLKDWAQKAGVRWGLDEATRTRFDAGSSQQNTWRFGLDRLLLGVAFNSEATLVDGVLGYSDIEGAGAVALGKLWRLLECLRRWSRELTQPADAGDWHNRFNDMLEDLFRVDPRDIDEQGALETIHEALAVFTDAAECLLAGEKLSWEAVRETLRYELDAAGERQPFFSGGVTFCGLVPLRAVPFRVVCMLGMNEAEFPRQESNREFNIIRQHPRLGDRNRRNDDRLLFLQALAAAGDVFYVSYTGQDIKDGAMLAPSPVISEWLDYIRRFYFRALDRSAFEARLIIRQPMHPFSSRYFDGIDPMRLFTFAHEWQPAGTVSTGRREPLAAFDDGSTLPAEPQPVIELSELKRFFRHPARYFFTRRLNMTGMEAEDTLADEETFALDRLRAGLLRTQLFSKAHGDSAETITLTLDEIKLARGDLPPPPLAQGAYAGEAGKVNLVLPRWHQWNAEAAPVSLDEMELALPDGTVVRGRNVDVWPHGPRSMRAGKLRMEHKLLLWIDLLFWCARHDCAGATCIAGLDDNEKLLAEEIADINMDATREHLLTLTDIFREGLQKPLLFHPGLAQSYQEMVSPTKKNSRVFSSQDALTKMNEKLTDSYNPSYLADDPYLRLLYRPGFPLGELEDDTRFCELNARICGPMTFRLAGQ